MFLSQKLIGENYDANVTTSITFAALYTN